MTLNILPSTLRNLFKKLYLIRKAEEEIVERYSEKDMRCPVHLSIGQEAVAAGVCEHLTKRDIVYSNHRCHAHYLAKGGNLGRMIAEIYGKETGCCGGKGGSMHLIDISAGFWGATPLVGNSLPIAVGVSFSIQRKRQKKIVVVFIGDGTIEEGVFHESLNFAVLHQLPILFVCENNLFSVYTHIKERQPKRSIYRLAEAHGIYSQRYDGYNVRTVYSTAKKAIQYIRSGHGPVFLEFLTYRWREHCGPLFDDHLGYRDPREVKKWMQRDSLKLLEREIIKSKVAKPSYLESIKTSIDKEIKDAFSFAKESPFPKKEALYEGLYRS